VLTTPHRKNGHICLGPGLVFVLPKQWKVDMRVGTWNMGSLYWSRTLTTVAKELARNKLEEVRCYKGGALIKAQIIFLWKRKLKSSTGHSLLFHHRKVSAFKVC